MLPNRVPFHVETSTLAVSQVFLNSLLVDSQQKATQTLVHELVHAYDLCRVYFDPTSCRHAACTEVRWSNPNPRDIHPCNSHSAGADPGVQPQHRVQRLERVESWSLALASTAKGECRQHRCVLEWAY